MSESEESIDAVSHASKHYSTYHHAQAIVVLVVQTHGVLRMTSVVPSHQIVGSSTNNHSVDDKNGDALATRRSMMNGTSHPLIPLVELTRSYEHESCPDERLVPIHDTILNKTDGSNETTTQRKIPRIIHMTAKTRCVTSQFSDVVDQWRCEYSRIVHGPHSGLTQSSCQS